MKKSKVKRLGLASGKNFLTEHSVDWHRGSLARDSTKPKLCGACKKKPIKAKESNRAIARGAANLGNSFFLKKSKQAIRNATTKTTFSSLNDTARTKDVKARHKEFEVLNSSATKVKIAANERKKTEQIISEENWE